MHCNVADSNLQEIWEIYFIFVFDAKIPCILEHFMILYIIKKNNCNGNISRRVFCAGAHTNGADADHIHRPEPGAVAIAIIQNVRFV